MKLHDLHPAEGSRRASRRIGRGIAAGQGKTAGRGMKGQFSRSSPGLPRGFEGGQMPLSQRLPKLRGFHNRWRKEYATVDVGKLNRFEPGTVVDVDTLRAAGLVGRTRHGVKLLGAGRLRVSLAVRVQRASAGARRAVEKAGGTLELLAPSGATLESESSAEELAASQAVQTEAAEQVDAEIPQGLTETAAEAPVDTGEAAPRRRRRGARPEEGAPPA